MLLRRFTDFILQGRFPAIGVAFVCAFIPLIGMLSILITALVTLRKGALEGFFVLCAATLPCLLGWVAPGRETEFLLLAVGIVVTSNVLTWLFAVLLKQHGNWSLTLEVAALLGVVVVGIVHIVYPDIQNGWATLLGAYFEKTAAITSQVHPDTAASQAAEMQDMLRYIKPYVTGFLVASVLFNTLLQLALARGWQALMFNPGGLRKELYQIRFGYLAGAIFALGVVLAYWGNETILDAIPVLYLIFCLAGLSLLHSLVGKTKGSWFWVLLIYVGLIGFFPKSVVVIAVIAFFDTGINFRKYFS